MDHMTQSPHVFTISKLAYFAVPVALLLVLMLMGISVPGFAWTIVVPLALIWWIRRLKTVVDEQGITAVGTFKTVRIPWHDVNGLRFPKWSPVCVVLNDDSSVRLPSVSFNDVPALAKASGGRVPDPFAAEREARLAAD